jgi:hypothetical protein
LQQIPDGQVNAPACIDTGYKKLRMQLKEDKKMGAGVAPQKSRQGLVILNATGPFFHAG